MESAGPSEPISPTAMIRRSPSVGATLHKTLIFLVTEVIFTHKHIHTILLVHKVKMATKSHYGLALAKHVILLSILTISNLQGSYRNLTVVFQTFPGQNYIHRTGLKFLNFEHQMLCVMNCKRIYKCMINQQCNRQLHFPGQHYSFQRFFQTFPYL